MGKIRNHRIRIRDGSTPIAIFPFLHEEIISSESYISTQRSNFSIIQVVDIDASNTLTMDEARVAFEHYGFDEDVSCTHGFASSFIWRFVGLDLGFQLVHVSGSSVLGKIYRKVILSYNNS